MGVKEKWVDLLYRAATSTKGRRNLLTPVGLAVFAATIAVCVALALLLDHWLGLPPLPPAPWGIYLSLPFFAGGGFLVGWSAIHFLKAKGTPVPLNPPRTLVVEGPYLHSRNPMLSGVFLLMVGMALALTSACLLLVFTPLFMAINLWEIVNIEEVELAKRFGQPYLDYQARTPRFLPSWRTFRKH